MEDLRRLVRNVLKKAGIGGVRERGLREAWLDLAGECSRETRVVGLHRGVVTIEVSSSARLMELAGFERERLLAGLQRKFKEVKEIRFRMGAFPDGDARS